MKEIRANLVHLGFSMWSKYEEKLACDDAEWKTLTDRMAASGYNMVVIDLAEGVRYESHPELAVEGSWTVEKLRAELGRLRSIGLEPIPKLNFSTAHDMWLGEYQRMVSTPEYYRVATDLIRETAEIFDTPRFFHLGFDEEDIWCHGGHSYVAMRQGELWWHDLLKLVNAVECAGMRAWIWSDWIWEHRDEFLSRMPRTVLQSNWYYDDLFDARAMRWPRIHNYIDLDRHGFDQVPTSSNYIHDVNTERTVAFARANLSPERLKGFLQTSWRPTTAEFRDKNLSAIDLLAATWGGAKVRKMR